MKPSSSLSWIAAGAALLLCLAWLYTEAPQEALPPTLSEVDGVGSPMAQVPVRAALQPQPEAPSALHQPAVNANGQAEPVVDTVAEDERAAARYVERIEANIAHLKEAADAARQRGQEELADVMDKRIDGLQRRLAEAEAANTAG